MSRAVSNRFHGGSGGGGGASLNLHCQAEEPTGTSGLWIKKAFAPNNVIVATSRFFDTTLEDDSWEAVAQLPVATGYGGVATYGDLIYYIGGETSSAVSTNRAYDPVTNTWSTKTAMTEAKYEFNIGVIDGVLYCPGGRSALGSATNTNYAYDINTNTWSTKAVVPANVQRGACIVVKGILLLIGGDNDSSTVSTNRAYDPVTNTWSTKTAMTAARARLTADLVNGIIYCIGGESSLNGAATNTNYAYDINTNTWSTKTAMTDSKKLHASGVVNGIIYCMGGMSSGGNYQSTNYAYDPGTNTWSTKTDMPTGRYSVKGVGLGELVYCIGGRAVSGISALVEVYSPLDTQVSENDVIIDTAYGTSNVDIINVPGIKIVLPVRGVRVANSSGNLESTNCAWHNGTAWTDIV